MNGSGAKSSVYPKVKIKSFLRIIMGQSPPSHTYNQNGDGLPFFQGVSDFGPTYPTTRIWCSSPKKIAERGQILFSVRAPVAEINLVSEKCAIGRGLAALEPDGTDLKYCFYLLSNFKQKFLSYSQGTTFEAINRDEISKIEVPFIQTLTEQKKIGSVISKVDELIQKTDQIIEQTQRLKKGLMQKLLTKGIGHTSFKKIELGTNLINLSIPYEWEIVNLGSICNIIDTPHYTSTYYSHGVPVIRTTDCEKSGEINYSRVKFTSDDEYKKRSNVIDPDIDDVLYTREAPPGVAVLVDRKKISIGQRIVLLKLNHDYTIGAYIVAFLNSHLGREQVGSMTIKTTVERVNIPSIKVLNIILPPVSEQKKITAVIATFSKYISIQKKYHSSLINLKKGLMQKLLTGKLRVKT